MEMEAEGGCCSKALATKQPPLLTSHCPAPRVYAGVWLFVYRSDHVYAR